MDKLNSFQDACFEKKQISEEKHKDNESKGQQEKILCNHCGRTSSNGIRSVSYTHLTLPTKRIV